MRFSLWGALKPPPEVTGSNEGAEFVVPICVCATFTMVCFGLSLELYLGPSLMALREGRSWWRMAQMSVGFSTLITGFAAPLWLGMPLFAAGVFHFGFPQITTFFRRVDTMFLGAACLLHHTAVSMAVVCIALELLETAHGLLLYLPLTLQHTFNPVDPRP